VRCEAPDQVLAESSGDTLSCADVTHVQGWIELLAGRPLQHNGRERLPRLLVDRFEGDAAGTRALIASVRERGAKLESTTRMKGGWARSEAVWEAKTGRSLITEDDPLWNLQSDALSVWAWDDDSKLALTEADVEGWITYASLCRQVQGGGVLKISVADRVTAYRMVIDRFEYGDRNEKLALVAIGPFWHQIKERWQASPYERQQAWIGAAPLPPPMTSSSLGYLEAILQGDVAKHAATLHDVLGPFSLNRGPRVFEETSTTQP
jgi:hypothetical protein